MKVIEAWDVTANFWEINPQFKVKETFNTIYKEDKSKGKIDSSRLMWGIALYADFESKYRQLPEKEKKELIANDLWQNPKFDWTTVKDIIKAWDVFKSAAQRQMMEWERFTNEKTEFLKGLSFDNIINVEIGEKLLLSNVKLYEAYEKINEKLAAEGEQGTIFGGGMESASEKGVI